MITSVNYRPKFYSSGYNPVIWSVTSDKATDPLIYDHAYVFDVYIDGSGPINRIVQRPNPSYAGMIDVSSFIQPYLNIGRFANEVGVPTSTPFKTGFDAAANIQLRVGEQWRETPAGELFLYPGTTNATPGDPAYVLGAQGYTQQPVVVLPSSLNWAEQQKTLQAQNTNPTDYYGLFGELAPYVLKNNSVLSPFICGGVGLFLSKSPRNVVGGNWRTSSAAPSSNITANDYAYDRHTVSFINRNPVYQYSGSGTLQSSSPAVAWYTFYDATGTQIGTHAVSNSTPYGGGPRTSCGGTITTFSQSNNQELVSLRVGPKDLEDIGLWNILGAVPAYYTVQLFANATFAPNCTLTATPTTPLSELITINITEDCTSYLYPRVRLSWLNSLGGRDYWNFTMFAEETISMESKEYYQTEMNWSGTTPVELTGDRTQNWLRGGFRQYDRTQSDSWTITSDWLTQDEVEYLKEVVSSSQVWAYIGQDDFPYTATIKQTSYTTKTIKMVKMYTVTFTVEFSTNASIQNI